MGNKAVIGVLHDQLQAERAVDDMQRGGFPASTISVLFPESAGTRDFAMEKNTKAPEGAVTGASAGGAIGGTLGLLAGIGALAIPGLGPFIAAGPIMAALSGAAAGAALGGIAGALVGMGIPEVEAKQYESRLKSGGILISVHTDESEQVARAKDILKRVGAEHISSSGEASVPRGQTGAAPRMP